MLGVKWAKSHIRGKTRKQSIGDPRAKGAVDELAPSMFTCLPKFNPDFSSPGLILGLHLSFNFTVFKFALICSP